MKIFILAARENWITDRLEDEWIKNNRELYTQNIQEADIIWILSNYRIHQIPLQYYQQKKVITTIHHIVPWKMDKKLQEHYRLLDQITDVFVTNQPICKDTLSKYTNKPIKVLPLWHNEDTWKIMNKEELRKKYNFEENDYLVGSFQKDTEGVGIAEGKYTPKLEKGPDNFVKAVTLLKNKHPNLKVVLTGYRRQFIIQELRKNNIPYVYFEMPDFKKLNELFNCLDLYIVASRVEGGPRAINECSLLKIPLFSTDVGIARLLCHPDSIFDMNNIETILNCKADVEYNYKEAQKYTINNYIKTYTKKLFFE